MNKLGIIAKIQSVLTGNAGVTTRADHEEALHTDSASILQYVDSPAVSFINGDASTIITYNANFTVKGQIRKIGGNVFLTGRFTSVGIQAAGASVITIADTDYTTNNLNFFDVAINSFADETIGIAFNAASNDLKTLRETYDGETFSFSINYKTLN